MSTIISEIFVNILGNIFTWLFLGVITLYLTSRHSQTHFLKFFGLMERKKVQVYFSNLWDPNIISNGPLGTILAGREFEASQILGRLFGSSPFSIPEIVRGLVDAFWIGRKCEVLLDISPMDDEFDKYNNLIVVGSAVKNRVRRIYAHKNCLHVIIDGEPVKIDDHVNIHSNGMSDQFQVLQGKRAGEVLHKPGVYELAIIEKIKEENQVIFFCLGKTGHGTRAVVEYLARKWPELRKAHDDKSFARCLWFPKHETGNNGPVDWEPVYFEDIYSE